VASLSPFKAWTRTTATLHRSPEMWATTGVITLLQHVKSVARSIDLGGFA